jgi:hypothetical protein
MQVYNTICNSNYTLYKNPGVWLVNSRCIFRVFSYLGLISFIFPMPGYLHEDLTFLLSRTSNRQIHSEHFIFTFIRKASWLIKFETRRCSEVKDLTFILLCRGICENVFHFFTFTCRKPPNVLRILQPLSNKTNRIFLKTTNKRYYLFSQCSKYFSV